MLHQKLPELVCPAGSLPALKAAIDNGADTVYFGYKNDTNALNFAGLNFDQKAMTEGGAGNGEHACELAASEYAYRCHV